MPTANNLTDAQCKRASTPDKPKKLFDGHGLYLNITTTGKTWRMAYRLAGKPQTATFGGYPLVSLMKAREFRDDLRRRLVAGESPKAVKTHSIPFAEACATYWAGRKDVSDGYRDNATRALDMHLAKLSTVPIGSITRDLLLDELMKLDAKGRHVYVRKVRMWASQVFDWAVERRYATVNPATMIRPEKAFGKDEVVSHASLELTEVQPFMARLALEGEYLLSVLGCKLMALTWVRTQELRYMQWSEIDGDLWRIPRGTMKNRKWHLVPLSAQALAVLAKLKARANGPYVFPAEHRNDRPMSENAVLYLIGRMGYQGKMTGHGWRSTASTWANERGFNADAIERQLAHVPDDEVRAAYNRAQYLDIRKQMLQDWADWLLPQSA